MTFVQKRQSLVFILCVCLLLLETSSVFTIPADCPCCLSRSTPITEGLHFGRFATLSEGFQTEILQRAPEPNSKIPRPPKRPKPKTARMSSHQVIVCAMLHKILFTYLDRLARFHKKAKCSKLGDEPGLRAAADFFFYASAVDSFLSPSIIDSSASMSSTRSTSVFLNFKLSEKVFFGC